MNKKQFGYKMYGAIARICQVFPRKEKKAVFYMVHNDHFCGNLRYLYEEIKKREPKGEYVVVSKAELFSGGLLGKLKGIGYFYFVLNYHFATASQVFLNDNFLPLAFMPVKKDTEVVQLWHGIGAWKRFGLTTEQDMVTRTAVEKGNQKITHLFVSAKRVVPFYQEAFGISEERIYPVGLPVLDFYFSQQLREQARRRFFESYPQLDGKKILLYTPTFRKTVEENIALQKKFDVAKLCELIGEEWVIVTRLHPSLQGGFSLPEHLQNRVIDASGYEDVKDLYEVATVLVNDYSSTMVEFALLHKPIVLFAYDLEEYDRGFYQDYQEHVPGPIVRDIESLAREVKKEEIDEERLDQFLDLHYDARDGENVKRILEIL